MDREYVKNIIILYDGKTFERSFKCNYVYTSHIGDTIKLYATNENSIDTVLEFSDNIKYIIEYW